MRPSRERRTCGISQTFIRTNPVGYARGKPASTEDVIHDLDCIIVRIVPANARHDDRHAPLVDVLIDDVNTRFTVLDFLRNRRRLFTGMGPAVEHAVQTLEHFVPVKVATDRNDEVFRVNPLVMKRQQILPSNAFDRGSGDMSVVPKLIPVCEMGALARLDAR